MKLHRIGNSKEPTLSQMKRMALNLRSKYKGFCTVEVKSSAYMTPSNRIKFTIYIENQGHRYTNSWPNLISLYRTLMKAKNV